MQSRKRTPAKLKRNRSKQPPARKSANRPRAAIRLLPRSYSPTTPRRNAAQPSVDIAAAYTCNTSLPPTDGTTVSACAALPLEEVTIASCGIPEPEPESSTVFTYDAHGRMVEYIDRTANVVTTAFDYTSDGLPVDATTTADVKPSRRARRKSTKRVAATKADSPRSAMPTTSRKPNSPPSAGSKALRKPATLKVESSRRTPITKPRRAA
jgi:YD repeat-containing protein